jgi:hypothetical protein
MSTKSQAEETAVTKPTVVKGLGYPNGREEQSPQPTGWFGGDVSRGTN